MENDGILEIKDKGKILALVFLKKIRANGVRFLTPIDYPLQVGLIEHKDGRKVPLHIHRNLRYKVNTTQEMLYIEKGKADVIIVDRKWNPVKEITLTAGDFVLFVGGGHGVNIHKSTRIIEIKQGPYPGDKKAKIFKK